MTAAGCRLTARGLRRCAATLTLALAGLALASCASGPPGPARLDTRNEMCGHCRMAVSDARFAAQIVAPGEEPRFFDDVGCLAEHLRAAGGVPRGGVAYVADHRTKAWVPVAGAVYTRVPQLETPMGSHIVAHADQASRAADPDAAAGVAVSAAEIFGDATGGPGRAVGGGRKAEGG